MSRYEEAFHLEAFEVVEHEGAVALICVSMTGRKGKAGCHTRGGGGRVKDSLAPLQPPPRNNAYRRRSRETSPSDRGAVPPEWSWQVTLGWVCLGTLRPVAVHITHSGSVRTFQHTVWL